MTDSTYFLVRLEPDMHVNRRNALMQAIHGYSGVESVTCLNAVTQETLDAILLAPSPPIVITEPEPVDLFSFAGVDVAS